MTREELIEYAFTMLGKPVIKIEVADSQIQYIIDDCLQETNGILEYGDLFFKELFVAKLGVQWGKNNLKFKDAVMPDNIIINTEAILNFYTYELERLRSIIKF